jgi:uncharacterized protein with NAD-binding domain and iron-sulfur cluster
MVKVAIFGAGISGLTVAHELISRGFQVDVYEKDSVVGGMAKSLRMQNNNMPTEHSWRGYAPFYKNTFQIQKQIPIKHNCENNNNIIDNNSNNSNIEKFTNRITLDEVKKHNTKSDLWTYYKGNVYDITKFISKHPGGNIILQAGGKDLEQIWKTNNVSWHSEKKSILGLLDKYKIGMLEEGFTNTNTTPSVFDNVKSTEVRFNLLQNSLTLPYENDIIKGIESEDIPYLYYKLLQFQMYGDARLEEAYKTKFIDEIKNNISDKSYKYLTDYVSGPGFGLDKNNMSVAHYSLFILFNIQSDNKPWKVMNQPTSEGWFNPWTKYLESKGVIFHYNQSLQKIYNKNSKNNKYSKNIIAKCVVNNTDIYADEYIIAINPFEYQKVLENSVDIIQNPIETNKQTKKLINTEIQKYNKLNIVNNQIGFAIGFNKKFQYKNKHDCFVLLDSPNNITFYPQDSHWCKNIYLGDNIKSLWSGTCVITYNNGSLYGKSLTLLTIEELKAEIIHQFLESDDLLWYIAKYNDGHIINKKDIDSVEIFADWKYDEVLYSRNKKFVNNIYNEEYRPSSTTDFANLYIAGAHTKTSVNIWSMEGAVESGKIVSNILLDKYNKPQTYIYKHRINNSSYALLHSLDNILYTFNLPTILNVITSLVIIAIITIIIVILMKI